MARRPRILRYFGYAFLAGALLASASVLYLDLRVTHEFEGRRFALPARIYARALELHAGTRIPQPDLEHELRMLAYKEKAAAEGEAGWFARREGELEIGLRPFMFWDGAQAARRIRVLFDSGVVRRVEDPEGREVALVRLEPLAIGGIYPAGNEDRELVRLRDVPKDLVEALIATEDRKFYSHAGFDLRAIARAALSLGTERVQGGSTITQQLVKNFFLTPERTVRRKATELVMAVLLEMHYGKEEILETYLNEIYLGQDPRYLTLAESALLVGMLKGPAVYDPRRHPLAALERRNLVLRETRDQGFITPEQYALARATPLGLSPRPAMGTSPHPAFV